MFKCFPALDSWIFIQGMTELKRFCIQRADRDTDPENITSILNYLPSTIERIDISSHGFPNGSRSIPISTLTGFPHLTYLDAQDCGILNIDDALQSICRTLTKLRVLHFGERHNSYITDLGLTGESSCGTLRDSDISLNNLKGNFTLNANTSLGVFLNWSYLCGCSRTSEEGLVKAVWFLELRVLKIDRDIPDSVLLEIAKNNPSLESVSREVYRMPLYFVKDEGLVFRNLLAVNPRLTRMKSYLI